MRIATLMESHVHEGRRLLRESCDGLTERQRVIVEGIYNELSPLIEASLAPQQIQQLFGEIEKAATAGGDNRTGLGLGVDVAKEANKAINNLGKWLQDTTPVKMFDQKFEQLKGKVSTKFPALAKQLTSMGEWAKANPGKLNYGSAGSGTSHHLAGELFKIQSKTDLTHIPYKGAGPALQGLLAGDVDLMFDGLGSSAQHIKSGRLNALMVAGSVRNPAIPDVPSAAELGFPNYTVTTWYGLWAPKGTPPEAQARMLAEIKKLPLDALIKDGWAANGAEFPDLTGAQFGAFVSAEIKRWAEVVKVSGAKLD
jgi:tripartite-type tricarboxylate transporter receptor subunit TctC